MRPDAQTAIAETCEQLVSIYAKLSAMAFRAKEKTWKMNPKLHLYIHLCVDQIPEIGNPRYFWTYGDEDLVGRLISIAEGLHPRTVAVNTLFKWMWCVFDEVLLPETEEFRR
eukprot:376491-Pyramimonas_sp.AAC.1